MKKICHITSVHEWNNTRILLKECQSLLSDNYEVFLVSEGINREFNGVNIIGCGEKPNSRISRISVFSKKVYNKALSLDCDVYHIHDPELLPYGVKLKKAGKKVVFDSHEDVPAQILDKDWLPSPMRHLISKIYKKYETYAVGQFDAVVAATPHIAEQFAGRCSRVVVVNNYPKLDDITFQETPFTEREPIICYAGGISEIRGEKIMTEAMQNVEGTLILAGDSENMSPPPRTKYVGLLNRKEINELYGSAVAGLCILKPVRNYFFSQPIKIYEYMAAGLPYICSDFPLWQELAVASGAGICVNPENTAELSKAISTLLADRKKAQTMGKKGREYVVKHCTWSIEEKSLLSLYETIGAL